MVFLPHRLTGRAVPRGRLFTCERREEMVPSCLLCPRDGRLKPEVPCWPMDGHLERGARGRRIAKDRPRCESVKAQAGRSVPLSPWWCCQTSWWSQGKQPQNASGARSTQKCPSTQHVPLSRSMLGAHGLTPLIINFQNVYEVCSGTFPPGAMAERLTGNIPLLIPALCYFSGSPFEFLEPFHNVK